MEAAVSADSKDVPASRMVEDNCGMRQERGPVALRKVPEIFAELSPAKVPLGLALRKGIRRSQQGQHFLCTREQGIQEVLAFLCLRLPFAFSRSTRCGGWAT